jgi:hypothetical protein
MKPLTTESQRHRDTEKTEGDKELFRALSTIGADLGSEASTQKVL